MLMVKISVTRVQFKLSTSVEKRRGAFVLRLLVGTFSKIREYSDYTQVGATEQSSSFSKITRWGLFLFVHKNDKSPMLFFRFKSIINLVVPTTRRSEAFTGFERLPLYCINPYVPWGYFGSLEDSISLGIPS